MNSKIVSIATMLVLWASSVPAYGQANADYAKFLKDKSGIYVGIKYVLKLQSEGGNSEREIEITGVMIDAAGLVLCSNTQFGSARFMRQYGTATPTDIKILIGEDTEGLPAKVLRRDSELDLAWVQIKDPKGKTFQYLDLTKAAIPAVGERIVFLRRMAKYFDRAITVNEGRLAGRTAKPRDLFVPGGSMNTEPGLPVFTGTGDVLGIVVIELPDEEEMQNNPGAFAGIGRDLGNGLILPAAEVIKATKRAQENPEEEKPEAKTDKKAGAAVKGDKKKEADDDKDEDEKPEKSKPAAKKPDQPKGKKPAKDDDDE